jgi:preprotein translocase subunit SecE
VTLELKAMELKKVDNAVTKKDADVSARKVVDFVGNIKAEFSKITWTTPDELRFYTKLVVGTTFIAGLAIYGIDIAIQGALSLLGGLFRLIFG